MIVTCIRCERDIVIGATEQQYLKWKAGALIQNAMPNLSPAEREILISGYCGDCFDLICGVK